MVEEPINVTDAAFEKTILQSVIPVVVDFWATWCASCKAVAPILEKFAKEFSGKLLIAKMNVDENPETPGRYGIQRIPTMLFIANGKIIHQNVGPLPESLLRQTVDQFLQVTKPIAK